MPGEFGPCASAIRRTEPGIAAVRAGFTLHGEEVGGDNQSLVPGREFLPGRFATPFESRFDPEPLQDGRDGAQERSDVTILAISERSFRPNRLALAARRRR